MDCPSMVFYERTNPVTGKTVCVAGGYELPVHKPFVETEGNLLIPAGLFCYQPEHVAPVYVPPSRKLSALEAAPADMFATMIKLAKELPKADQTESVARQGVFDGEPYELRVLGQSASPSPSSTAATKPKTKRKEKRPANKHKQTKKKGRK